MLNTLDNIVKFTRYYGCPELLRRLCKKVAGPFYKSGSYYILRVDLRLLTQPQPDLFVVELTTDDIEPMLTVMYVSRTDLLKRFAGGDRCFATVEDGKIVNYFWVTFNARQSQELNLKFRLAGDQAWLYNAITIKAARGRGLYPNIVRHIAKMLRQSGFTEAFIEVEQKNTASLRGLEKARCSRVALITWRRVFTRTFYRITVFDYVTWQRLSENIEAYSSLNKRVRPVYES